MKGSTFFLALALAFGAGADDAHTADWRFTSERIRLTVADGVFYVESDYWFAAGDERVAITYPFPDDAALGEPELLGATLVDDDGERPLHVDTTDPVAWSWGLEAGAPTTQVRVRYRQPMFGDRAVYVLRSAAGWPTPLEWAELSVVLPAGRRAEVPPGFTRCGGGYRGRFDDWVPDGDLVVELLDP